MAGLAPGRLTSDNKTAGPSCNSDRPVNPSLPRKEAATEMMPDPDTTDNGTDQITPVETPVARITAMIEAADAVGVDAEKAVARATRKATAAQKRARTMAQNQARWRVTDSPFWQKEYCPVWCTSTHYDDAKMRDRFHGASSVATELDVHGETLTTDNLIPTAGGPGFNHPSVVVGLVHLTGRGNASLSIYLHEGRFQASGSMSLRNAQKLAQEVLSRVELGMRPRPMNRAAALEMYGLEPLSETSENEDRVVAGLNCPVTWCEESHEHDGAERLHVGRFGYGVMVTMSMLESPDGSFQLPKIFVPPHDTSDDGSLSPVAAMNLATALAAASSQRGTGAVRAIGPHCGGDR